MSRLNRIGPRLMIICIAVSSVVGALGTVRLVRIPLAIDVATIETESTSLVLLLEI